MTANGMCPHNNMAGYCPTCATLKARAEYAAQVRPAVKPPKAALPATKKGV